jgi:hypothetical protein
MYIKIGHPDTRATKIKVNVEDIPSPIV